MLNISKCSAVDIFNDLPTVSINEQIINLIIRKQLHSFCHRGHDAIQVQSWIPYSKHSVKCFILVVDMIQYMVQPWVFHDGFSAFGQI